jgi:hypothetical protein
MFKTRDVVMFLSGAFFLHTVSHIIFPYIISLPVGFNLAVLSPNIHIVWTPTLNLIVVIVSAVITVGLLWCGSRLK